MPAFFPSRVQLGTINAIVQRRIKLRDEIAKQEELLQDFKYRRLEFIESLDAKVRETLKSGVAVVYRYENNHCTEFLRESLEGVLKSVLQELKRPFVLAQQVEGRPTDSSSYQVYWRLRIPRNQQLKAIAAPLLLVADNHVDDTKKVVLHEVHERTWQFVFVGGKGTALFEHWLSQCRTDPVYRITLGLPLNPDL